MAEIGVYAILCGVLVVWGFVLVGVGRVRMWWWGLLGVALLCAFFTMEALVSVGVRPI